MNFLWYNFVTKTFDIRDTIVLDTDKEALKYIPDTDFARSIYNKIRKNNKDIKESVKQVLQIYYKTKN